MYCYNFFVSLKAEEVKVSFTTPSLFSEFICYIGDRQDLFEVHIILKDEYFKENLII